MIIGIVGLEQKKFTQETEEKARVAIRELLKRATVVVSGECPLGGVDIFAKEEAAKLNIPFVGFAPEVNTWDGSKLQNPRIGFKQRNELIAQKSDEVVCITLTKLPQHFTGMRFELCYHCGVDTHVKSGGCWTAKRARQMGKLGYPIVLEG